MKEYRDGLLRKKTIQIIHRGSTTVNWSPVPIY